MSARKGRLKKVYPLMSKAVKLITKNEEKAEVFKNFFASVFTAISPPTPLK